MGFLKNQPSIREKAVMEALGLSWYGTRALLALLEARKPLGSAEIVARSKVPRSKVYEVVYGLVRKGFAQKCLKYPPRPAEFAAYPWNVWMASVQERRRKSVLARRLLAQFGRTG